MKSGRNDVFPCKLHGLSTNSAFVIAAKQSHEGGFFCAVTFTSLDGRIVQPVPHFAVHSLILSRLARWECVHAERFAACDFPSLFAHGCLASEGETAGVMGQTTDGPSTTRENEDWLSGRPRSLIHFLPFCFGVIELTPAAKSLSCSSLRSSRIASESPRKTPG